MMCALARYSTFWNEGRGIASKNRSTIVLSSVSYEADNFPVNHRSLPNTTSPLWILELTVKF